MNCEGCVSNIKKTLSSSKGIITVDVSLDKKRGKIAYNTKQISADKITAVIKDLGFTAGAIQKETELVNDK